MPPLMRVERAFPLRWPLSLEHGFGRFLARRQVAGGDWALVQLSEFTGGAFLLVEALSLLDDITFVGGGQAQTHSLLPQKL